jgi:hypothetical protein
MKDGRDSYKERRKIDGPILCKSGMRVFLPGLPWRWLRPDCCWLEAAQTKSAKTSPLPQPNLLPPPLPLFLQQYQSPSPQKKRKLRAFCILYISAFSFLVHGRFLEFLTAFCSHYTVYTVLYIPLNNIKQY